MKLTGVNGLTFKFAWRVVTDSSDPRWPFGERLRLSKDLGKLFAGPRVYRFVFPCNEEFQTQYAYVGQAENFSRRYYGYCRADKKVDSVVGSLQSLNDACRNLDRDPNVRVRSMIFNWMLGGHRVELQFLDFESFHLNRVFITQGKLSNPFVRGLVENIAVLDTETEGYYILNRGRDTQVKQWTKWFTALRERSMLRAEAN